MKYRNLSESEIKILENQGCSALDGWKNILVTDIFIPQTIKNTVFSGVNYLGEFNKKVELDHFFDIAGIYNAHIHNCTIGNNVYIKNIGTSISNYKICDDAIIINTGTICMMGTSSFGNGVKVSPINEAGGREILIYNELSVHTAYLMAFYAYKKGFQKGITNMIMKYADEISSDQGTIESHARVINCNSITNTYIGEYAKIEGVSYLNNGSINSCFDSKTYVGHNVKASDFIISSSSIVSDGAYLRHCFVGQGCEISNHYTAENSVFFANSQCLQGEACSIFAGPYTVTHHKSTLLIAGYYSFYNAGSGTNQSNHMYKLGPVHQGIIERGCKTGSDSYILWPAQIGAFTMILGRHYSNPDISDLPFSYLIEDDGKSVLMPAQNIFNVGTARDVEKWPNRDKRKGKVIYDKIITEALNPYTINKIIDAINILKQLNEKAAVSGKVLMYKNTQISTTSINRGIKLYEQALIKYIGDELVSLLKNANLEKVIKECTYSIKEWIDLGGLICPKDIIESFLDDIENGRLSLDQIVTFYENRYKEYPSLKQQHAFSLLQSYFQFDIDLFNNSTLSDFIKDWIDANNKILASISMDAKKEFNPKSMISFGMDGNKNEQELDFLYVRGSFEENSFLKNFKNEIDTLNNIGNNIIQTLS